MSQRKPIARTFELHQKYLDYNFDYDDEDRIIDDINNRNRKSVDSNFVDHL